MSRIIDERQKIVADLMPVKTQAEIATEVGVTPRTIARDVAVIKKAELPALSSEAYMARALEITNIQEEITFLRADAESLPVSQKQILLRAQILDRRIKLLELATPRVTANITTNIEADPSKMKIWQRAVYELRHIPEDKLPVFWSRVQPVIAELEEREIVLDGSYYPTKAAITGGNDESN